MHEGPDYVVLTDGGAAREFLREALDDKSVRIVTDLSEFRGLFGAVHAAAAILPDLTSGRARELMRLMVDERRLPFVLATDLTPENASELNRLPSFSSVIFLNGAAVSLLTALRQAASTVVLLEAAAMIEGMDYLTPILRAALAKACRQPEPVRTVNKLAERVMGYAPSTLRQHWREEAAPNTKPHDFIDWLLVAHASIKWSRHGSLCGVAGSLGVHPASLRAAMRRVGQNRQGISTNAGGVDVLLTHLRALLERDVSDSTEFH
jgi:hypothetical protein